MVRFAAVLADILIAASAGICLAWIAGAPGWTQLAPASPPVSFNTALTFVMCGTGLRAALSGFSRLAVAVGMLASLAGVLTLEEYLSSVSLGVDELFLRVPPAMHLVHPGRMAPNTASALALAGLGVALAGLGRRPSTLAVAGVLGSIVSAIGLVALTGYVFGIAPAFEWGWLTRMAALTAAGLAVLGVALVLATMGIGRAASWSDVPWLSASVGVGLSLLVLLGWQALRTQLTAEATGPEVARLPNLLLGLGLLVSMLMAGLVAQTQNLRHRAAQLGEVNRALERSSGQIRDLYDGAPCGYHSLDADGLIVEINRTELEWLGYSREELVGRVKAVDLVTPASRAIVEVNYPQFMRTGSVRDLELEFICKDGSLLPVLLSATAVKDAEGRFLRSRSTIYDMRERRNAESMRRLLSLVVENSNDAVISSRPDGTITSWNPAATALFGYGAGEMIGNSLTLLASPEQLARGLTVLERVRRGETVGQFDMPLCRKDGAQVEVSLTASPIRDSAGAVTGIASIVRDVSERRRLEQALEQGRAQLQSVLDGVHAAVMVYGADARIKFANPQAADLLGVPQAELIGGVLGDPRWRLVREDGTALPVQEHPISLALQTRGTATDRVVGIRSAGGAVRWLLVNAVCQYDRQGAVREVIESFIDISERRRMAQELERLATLDVLTELGTRRHFLEVAGREIKRLQRHGGELSLMILDVDHFKKINDVHGHQGGDAVLQHLGQLIRLALREVDIAGRLGGEEFCIALPDTTHEQAMEVAERLRGSIAAGTFRLPDGTTLEVTASIGVASMEPGDAAIEALLGRADQAMYQAKRSGRNAVRGHGSVRPHSSGGAPPASHAA